MRRFVDRYVANHGADAAHLYVIPEYVLGRLKGEAMALSECRPNNHWLRDQATIVIGYVEAYAFFPEDEFPWGHVVEIISKMRRIIVRAEHLAAKAKADHHSVGQAA